MDNELRIIDRLDSIIKLLTEMKEQEKDYWETWRKKNSVGVFE